MRGDRSMMPSVAATERAEGLATLRGLFFSGGTMLPAAGPARSAHP